MKRMLACTAIFVAASLTSASLNAQPATTATPIQHVIVIFDENVSFDHYFATYPSAANPPAEPAFHALASTPRVNNLVSAGLLRNNPNFSNASNGASAAEPFRLDRTEANTADQNHAYTAEQQAYDDGKADLFPKYTGKGSSGGVGAFATAGQVMGYFDGNTVTAIWRYAQHYAMSDNAYTDTYGPSTPGAINVVSGQTNGLRLTATTKQPSTLNAVSYYIADGQGGMTLINDVDPSGDVCSNPSDQAQMTGRNIGSLLNAANISWGAFMGGFDLQTSNSNGTTGCKRSTHSLIVAQDVADYIPHQSWFQFYADTANPTHARPSAAAAIGSSFEADGITLDPAHHEYDLNDFFTAVKAGHLPAVSYIKFPAFQNGHPGYSNPLDEQTALVTFMNFVQARPEWKSTAVILLWDDSDGWYDHAFTKVTTSSRDQQVDQLDGPGVCGTGIPRAGLAGTPVNGRCGPGTRVPFLVLSPWAKANVVSHSRITQCSVIRFIEDNWLAGKRLGGGSFDAQSGSILDLFDFTSGGHNPPLFLDAATGNAVTRPPF